MASVTGMTAAAITSIENAINAALALKADLVNGVIPDGQMPADIVNTAALATALVPKADLVGGVLPDAEAPAIAVKKGDLLINARDAAYGATGNGTTADDAAILAAIAAVPSGRGGIVYLPAGQYFVNGATALALTQIGTHIRGAGVEATKIVVGPSFTGTSVFSITADDCSIRDLSIVGQQTTTTSNPAVNAVKIVARRPTIQNVNFWYINAWCIEDDGSPTNSNEYPEGSMFSDIRARYCAGGIHYLGNSVGGSYAINSLINNFQMVQGGVATGPSANLDAVCQEDGWDLLATNLLVWMANGTGNCFHVKGDTAATFVKNLDALGPATGCNVLVEDGPNGSPQNLQFDGGVIQQGLIGFRVTGGATHLHASQMRFINNKTHAISIEGTGSPISFQDVFISGSGAGATGTNYDINWAALSTGFLDNVRFASPIVATGTAGVQYSMYVQSPSSPLLRVINAMFLGTGAAASNWYTTTPTAALHTSAGVFEFTTGVNLNGGAAVKSNMALQPGAQTNTVMSSNTNGTDQYDTWRLDGTGKMAVGPGGTTGTRDASWGRQGTAIFGTADSDVQIGFLGKGLKVKAGTNGKVQTATLAAGTVTIANTSITANSCIIPFYRTPSANAGALYVSAVTVGTSCVIKSTNASDTGVIGVFIVEAV